MGGSRNRNTLVYPERTSTIIDMKNLIIFHQIIDLTIALKNFFGNTIDLTIALSKFLEEKIDLTLALKNFFLLHN